MEGHESDSRYLTLWLCVIVSAVIIFGGWIFVMKYNFNKINAEMEQESSTMEGAMAQVDDIFQGVSDLLDEQGLAIEKLQELNVANSEVKTETEKAEVVE